MNKYKRLHELCKVSIKDFEKLGIHDGYVGIDSKYFIDLAKLRSTSNQFFKNSYNKLQKYYDDCVACAEHSNFTKLDSLLRFNEAKEIALGVSMDTYLGRGLTGQTSKNYSEFIKEMYDLNIRLSAEEIIKIAPPSIENVGVDRTSDMIAQIIRDDIIAFTDSMMSHIGITNQIPIMKHDGSLTSIHTLYRDETRRIPVLLLPTSILSAVPKTVDYCDIGNAITSNEECRNEIEKLYQTSINKAIRQMSKKGLRKLIAKFNLYKPIFLSAEDRERKEPDLPYESTVDYLISKHGLVDLIVNAYLEISVCRDCDLIANLFDSIKLVLESGIIDSRVKAQIDERMLKVLIMSVLCELTDAETFVEIISQEGSIIKVTLKKANYYFQVKTAKRTRHAKAFDVIEKLVASDSNGFGAYLVIKDNDSDVHSKIFGKRSVSSKVKYREIDIP